MNNTDFQYIKALEYLLAHGSKHQDRTGVGTRRTFVYHFEFNVGVEFPIITCKKASFKNTIAELLWFLSGSTKLEDLKKIKPSAEKWWADFTKDDGTIGPLYGRQLIDYSGSGFNQIEYVLNTLKKDPNSRRVCMTTFNPSEQYESAKKHRTLYPCHGLYTHFMTDGYNLDMYTVQRSADWGCGLPHNWISYAALLSMIAQQVGLAPRFMKYTAADLHIYENHIPLVENVQFESHGYPTLGLKQKDKFEDFSLDDFSLINYKSGPLIKLELAV